MLLKLGRRINIFVELRCTKQTLDVDSFRHCRE